MVQNQMEYKHKYGKSMIKDYLFGVMKALRWQKTAPLSDVKGVCHYVEKQAAFVSQFTLYGYIKARAGTQYPKLFDNDRFVESMKIARWHIFGASVCDLALFVAAQLAAEGYPAHYAEALAARIIESILGKTAQDDTAQEDIAQENIDATVFTDLIARGKARAVMADWQVLARGSGAFQSSADALIRWAPIAEEMKADDDEIVRNSIHMKWIGVRREIKSIIKASDLIADLNRLETRRI